MKEDNKHIYIGSTIELWGGQNGEVSIQTDNGYTLTFSAFNLYRDLPALMEISEKEIKLVLDEIKNNFKQ
jgi:hypothetical protein